MFRFVKQIYVSAMSFFSCNALEFISMSNQEYKIRRQVINANGKEPLFYPYSVKINKPSSSCNNIDDLHAKMCIPDVVKNINVKAFNLMWKTNETRHIEWNETCKCKYGLDASVCNNKQCWNKEKCRCQCK